MRRDRLVEREAPDVRAAIPAVLCVEGFEDSLHGHGRAEELVEVRRDRLDEREEINGRPGLGLVPPVETREDLVRGSGRAEELIQEWCGGLVEGEGRECLGGLEAGAGLLQLGLDVDGLPRGWTLSRFELGEQSLGLSNNLRVPRQVGHDLLQLIPRSL